MPCLPFGNYYLYTQSEIDNFQLYYPGCIDLEGNVSIHGADITNLQGLGVINSIEKNLLIEENTLLHDLSGLEGLVSIGGDLMILGNDTLVSLDGLENLMTVGGSLYVGDHYENAGNHA